MLPAAFGVAIAVLPIRLYTERKLRRNIYKHVTAAVLCAVAFTVVVLLGVLRSPHEVEHYGRTKVLKFLVADLIPFLFVVLFITDLREMRYCIFFMLACACAELTEVFAAHGMGAFGTYFYVVYPPQTVGPFNVPSGPGMGYRFSLYALTCYLLCLYFRRWPVKGLFLAAGGLFGFFCFMTAVRGAVLFTGILAIGITLVWFRFRILPAAAAAAVMALGVYLSQELEQEIHHKRWSELSTEIGPAGSRAYMAKWALQDSRNHILFGGGSGATARMPFFAEARRFGLYFNDGADAGYNRFYPHNGPLEVLDEFGLVGLIPYLLFFGLTTAKGLAALLRTEFRSPRFLLCLWCLVMMGQDVMRIMISGDISDALRAWMFTGAVLVVLRAIHFEDLAATGGEAPSEPALAAEGRAL